MDTLRLGDFAIDTVLEIDIDLDPPESFPDATPEALAPHRHWLEPHFMTPRGHFRMVVQTYVIRTSRHLIIVDTCFGNDKERDGGYGHRLGTPFLERLRHAGVAPEKVDFVFCTHLHTDHVGWNTRLENGRWVPSFPNARYLFGREDWTYFRGITASDYGYAAIQDSVKPIVEAKQAVFVESGFELEDGILVTPSPGHTPGHASLALRSRGQNAMMVGDLLHHPVQCAEPSWELRLTLDPTTAQASRRRCLEELCESNGYLLAAHFNAPHAGQVVPQGRAWRLKL
jgi:glyoxylase-like metal-dependent hydrolase (beta-lactamase superfamily II)